MRRFQFFCSKSNPMVRIGHAGKVRSFSGFTDSILKSVISGDFQEAQAQINQWKNQRSVYVQTGNSYGFVIRGRTYPEFRPRSEFQEKYSTSRVSAIHDAAFQVNLLFNDHKKCFALLKVLDEQIKLMGEKKGWCYSDITRTGNFEANDSLLLPPPCSDSGSLVREMNNLHLYLMRKQLNKFDIDLQDKHYYFVGFVSRKFSDDLIRQGALYSEDLGVGGLLIHGADTHYFQWYLISLAIEAGMIKLKDGLTLIDFLKSTVDFKNQRGVTLWDELIDHFLPTLSTNMQYQKFYKGSPSRLNVALMLDDDLPNLRGYMLNQWYLTVERLQNLYFKKFKCEIPYECLVAAHAASKGDLGKVNFISRKELFLYDEDSKKKLLPTTSAGIYYSPVERLFANVESIETQALNPEEKSSRKKAMWFHK